jgi:UDP-arabinose 4-epimerase
MTDRVLVVGGAGYVGSHAAKALAHAGYDPVVVDNLITGHRDSVRWGDFEECDIRDTDRLSKLMAKHRPRTVMHFAAHAYVGESVSDPEKYYDNNIVGTLSLLRAMRLNEIESIVFSSTCATYGTPETLPITELTAQKPINPYGFTKLVMERALDEFGHAYGLKWVAFRYFNAAGCDPDGELGERHDPETHAIPLAIGAAMKTRPPFKIFGTDYDTRDGTAIRDYIHVSDLADAHVQALPYIQNNASRAFNLGTGCGTTVLEMIEAVEQATGQAVPTERCNRRPGDPPALFAAANAAQNHLGWQPRYTHIKDIVASAASWFAKPIS